MKNSLLALFYLMLLVMGGCVKDETRSDSSSFDLHPDFEIELVASEPVIFDPVDLKFDEMGHAYVMEMPGYPLGIDKSRLIRLVDDDQDGIYEGRDIFAEDLRQASSFLPYAGGFLVASPPFLLFVTDTDNDGLADQRDTLMDGFSDGNLQHNFNGLSYALDNWIYAGNGGNDGKPYWLENSDSVLDLYGADFRMKPDHHRFERSWRSTGGHEITFDKWGRVYLTHNTRHISSIEFLAKYRGASTLIPSYTRHNISDHDENDLARIYPIGQQETRVNHPEQSGYFSGGCGITYYGGGSYPASFEGNVFVADVVLNLVHRDVINPVGSTVVASRGRKGVEFLASSDRHFRPVNITIGPDGSMYIIDIHRAVIEHPEWIPDELEAEMDLDAGKEKGRIYRITPKDKDWIWPEVPGAVDDAGLVELLSDANQWMRLTSQRLLIERDATQQAGRLVSLISSDRSPEAKIHALWVLEGLHVLTPEVVLSALIDSHPRVREHGLKVSEEYLNDPVVLSKVIALSKDEDVRVRLQTALTLSVLSASVQDSQRKLLIEAVSDIVQLSQGDIWSLQAVVLASAEYPFDLIRELQKTSHHQGLEPLFEMLAISVTKGTADDVEELLSYAAIQDSAFPYQLETIRGLRTGVQEWAGRKNYGWSSHVTSDLAIIESTLQTISDKKIIWQFREVAGLPKSDAMNSIISEALLAVKDSSLTTEQRMDYLEVLPLIDFSITRKILFDLLSYDQPISIQSASIHQLSQVRSEGIADELIQIWPSMAPSVRRVASNILLYQDENHDRLLDAFENNELRLAEFNFDLERRRRLLTSNDPLIRSRAEALFTDAGVVQRKDAIEAMKPAIEKDGDPRNGKEVFIVQCAQCHRYGDQGVEVGPDLTEISRKSRETLLHDILDPNAAADVGYINHIIETNTGVMAGIIIEQSDQHLITRTAGGKEEIIPRSHVRSIESTGMSLMPEGMEGVITVDEMADLLAYLQGGIN